MPGDLALTTLHAGDRVLLPTTQSADMPDEIVASFYATHGVPSTESWTAAAILVNGTVSFSIPADSVADSGDLVVCGGYSINTTVGSCTNATCTLSMFTRGDCRSYAISID